MIELGKTFKTIRTTVMNNPEQVTETYYADGVQRTRLKEEFARKLGLDQLDISVATTPDNIETLSKLGNAVISTISSNLSQDDNISRQIAQSPACAAA